MRISSRLTAAAALVCLPAMAFAAGAIAVDDQEGQNPADIGWGYSTGHDTRDEAGRAALRECRKHGNKNCKVVVRFDSCGAYAASRKHYGIGWGSSKAAAQRIALRECGENCQIVGAVCEDD
ncbi:MAG: DUF4189 domain-containing protein [Alphaproteobacteria bacterium]|nr:DUF4189 domain-containing protein [Alphaproteobacteria bacterium]